MVATPKSGHRVKRSSGGGGVLVSPPRNGGCCLPMLRFKRKGNKKVGFSPHIPATSSAAASTGSSEQSSPNSAVFRSARRRRSLRRCSSRKTFYSCVSEPEDLGGLKFTDTDALDATPKCSCGFDAHTIHDPNFPIIVEPNIEPGSEEELRCVSRAMLGKWVTILERSESLDPQMAYMGINRMKRMVMNRLATPFGAVLTEDNKTLKCWIETPLGNKYTQSSLVGEECVDEDPDLGSWSAKTHMTDFVTPLFCSGSRSVRAMQQERRNSKYGLAYETKVVLPDSAEGKILLYNIAIHPVNSDPIISVNRVYKFVGPIV